MFKSEPRESHYRREHHTTKNVKKILPFIRRNLSVTPHWKTCLFQDYLFFRVTFFFQFNKRKTHGKINFFTKLSKSVFYRYFIHLRYITKYVIGFDNIIVSLQVERKIIIFIWYDILTLWIIFHKHNIFFILLYIRLWYITTFDIMSRKFGLKHVFSRYWCIVNERVIF